MIEPQGSPVRKHGYGPRQVEVCTHSGMALREGYKSQRLAVWEQPLRRFCRLALPLISKLPEEQSYPREDQMSRGVRIGSLYPWAVYVSTGNLFAHGSASWSAYGDDRVYHVALEWPRHKGRGVSAL